MRSLTIASMFALLGCRATTPTPESEPTAEPIVFVEQARPTDDGPVERLVPITPGVCPAEVDVVPAAYFEERVLLRLPVGLDDSNLIETGPLLARTSRAVESIDCRPDAVGGAAAITFAALTLQDDQTVLSLEAARAHAMTEFGYPSGYAIVEGVRDPDKRRGMWVVELGAGEPAPTRALIVLKASSGFMVALVLETSRAAWPALVDSFVESGNRLLVVPG